jgi:hypothetical protein
VFWSSRRHTSRDAPARLHSSEPFLHRGADFAEMRPIVLLNRFQRVEHFGIDFKLDFLSQPAHLRQVAGFDNADFVQFLKADGQ